MGVPARLSLVTLGVRDLERSRAFYRALGWQQTSSGDETISWFRTANTYLGLFGYESLAKDAGLPPGQPGSFGGITLAINVESEALVDDALAEAVRAGGTLLKAATRAEWGGYSGYFSDPDGYPWEVAFNPFFPIDADGRTTIP